MKPRPATTWKPVRNEPRQVAPEPSLPCFPCPHDSVCCKHGTALTREEGEALLAEFGSRFVYYDRDKKGVWGNGEEFRTQTWSGRCAFHKNGGCMIHRHPHYPTMCRLFPFMDARNPLLPHAFDAHLCPELLRSRSIAKNLPERSEFPDQEPSEKWDESVAQWRLDSPLAGHGCGTPRRDGRNRLCQR